MKKVISVLCVILTVLCVFAGCGKAADLIETKDPNENKTIIGNGNTEFIWEITDKDGNISSYKIATNDTNLATVLTNYGLAKFEGKKGDSIVINGYELTGDSEWLFAINGEKSKKSPSKITIEDGAIYSFVME